MAGWIRTALHFLVWGIAMYVSPLRGVAAPPVAPTTQDGEAAGQAQKTFDSVFGTEARRVTASSSAKARVDFARKLLDATDTVHDDPAVEALVYLRFTRFI